MLQITPCDGTRGADGRLKLAAYYIDYAAATELPGRWYGAGAETLGLASGSQVDPELLLQLAESKGSDGQLLNPYAGQSDSRPFFDVQVSVPKSLSVLAYCHPDATVRAGIRSAVEDANADFVAFLEAELARSRRGHQGRDGVVDAKLIVGGFRHGTSRDDDPQVHTHLLLLNLCLGEDGRWRTLDTNNLFGSMSPDRRTVELGKIHESFVRARVRARGIHIDWTQPDDHQTREIAGFDRGTIDAFSKRTWAIKDAVGADDTRKGRQVAAFRTRKKKSEATPQDLIAGWREQLQRYRWTDSKLRKLTSAKQREWSPPDTTKLLRKITTSRTTFGRIDILGALALAAPAGASVEQLVAWTDAILASDAVVTLTEPMARQAGVPYDPTQPRWSTPEAIATERGMIDLAMTCRHRGGPVIDGAALEAAIAAGGLDGEQADAIRFVAQPGLVRVIEAEAGTGKTHSLRALVASAEASGIPVVGLALSGQAVVELAEGAEVEALTIAAWSYPRGQWAGAFAPGTLVIVDEASMVDNPHMAAVIQAAHEVGGKVVLVGDREQLGAVEAGGAFAALADKLGAASITENRRMADERLVDVAKLVRTGRAAEAVGRLGRMGRIVVAADPEQAAAALLGDWWEAREAGHQTRILAYRRRETAMLNALARQMMAEHGKLTGKVLAVDATTKGKGLPAREFQVGDEVVCLTRSPWSKIGTHAVNGTRGTISKIDQRWVTITDPKGHVYQLSKAYVADWLDHGYATTEHKSQGSNVGKAAAARKARQAAAKDVGKVFIYGADTMSRQAGYVGITRATDDYKLYLYESMMADEQEEWHDTERDPLAAMARSWAKSEAQDLGITEAERRARVLDLAANSAREDMEPDYKLLADMARYGKTDPVVVLAEAAWSVALLDAAEGDRTTTIEQAEAARVAIIDRAKATLEATEPDPAERATRLNAVLTALQAPDPAPDQARDLTRAKAHLMAVEKRIAAWEKQAPNLVHIRAEASLLAEALATQRQAAIIEAVAEQPAWMVKILGPVPDDTKMRYPWAEAAGDLIDAEFWITQARRGSKSLTVQDMADADTVRWDLVTAATSDDLRQLEDLVSAEEADAALERIIAMAPPTMAGQLAAAPAVRRVAVAIAACGTEIDEDAIREALGTDEHLKPGKEHAEISIALAAYRLREAGLQAVDPELYAALHPEAEDERKSHEVGGEAPPRDASEAPTWDDGSPIWDDEAPPRDDDEAPPDESEAPPRDDEAAPQDEFDLPSKASVQAEPAPEPEPEVQTEPVDLPAAARLALLPGVGYPATRATMEAGALRVELAGAATATDVLDDGEIADDVTPDEAPVRQQPAQQAQPDPAVDYDFMPPGHGVGSTGPEGPTLSL